MPQLHLPPVVQAVAVLLGVALAVTRLLTASKAFWWLFPEWVQKGAPALLVAVGMLPQALENAHTWLDVAQALMLSVGAWFTASRGDKRPVEPPKSEGDPKPEPPREHIRFDDVTPSDPPTAAMSVWRNKWPIVGCCLVLLACMPEPKTIIKPCSTVELATIVAGCDARIRLECNVNDTSCLTYQECSLAIKNWRSCGESQ